MKDQITQLLKHILAQIGVSGVNPEVEIPEDASHGDYSSAVALKAAKILKKAPMEIALEAKKVMSDELLVIRNKKQHQNISQEHQTVPEKPSSLSILQDIDRVEVAPPGFVNFYLTEAKLSGQLGQVINAGKAYGTAKTTSKKIMVEFAHPNTHKAFHIGHLRNITTGESVVRLLESQGTQVIRANYQGDVGMHIAKCVYALTKVSVISSQLSAIRKKDIKTKVEFLGKAYAAGSKAYEENDEAKAEIGEINKQIYAKDSSIYALYEETRQWSLDYFEAIYQRVGSHFDRYYFESEVYESGKKIVLEALKKGIFEKSAGAIIFPGEKFARLDSPPASPEPQRGESSARRGLHNRVFITSEGNTTYEGKDIGLGQLQFAEYHPDRIIHVVGPEQAGYFQVLFEALAQVFPETRGKEQHLIYGWVKLKQGKMSSRSGNVVLGEWLLDEAKKEIYNIIQKSASKYKKELQDEIAEKAAVAAVKYSFLKVGTEKEISFDLKESINFEGDSGPYLQYTYARCQSVLRKADKSGVFTNRSRELTGKKMPVEAGDQTLSKHYHVSDVERRVMRLIFHFPDKVAEASLALSPNTMCQYLFTLAQEFNLFYAKHSILGIAKSPMGQGKGANSRNATGARILRLSLTSATAQVLKNGLYLLGIDVLEQM